MFKNLFKKRNEVDLYAPCSGKIIALENVSDPVFNQKMMGEGIAIIPAAPKIVAPFNGRVVQIPETNHAVGLNDEHNNEVLLHIGLETVGLNGEGFKARVQTGDYVETGEILMELDLDYLQKNAKDIITPIVITNNEKQLQLTDASEAIISETVIMTLSDK